MTTENAVVTKSPAFFDEEIIAVHHWTDELFSFQTTRDPGFRFQSGQFVMLGLTIEGRPLLRAYSIASPSWSETLEFYSIKVPNGPFTSRLRQIGRGDRILIGRKPTGTLVMGGLRPGRTLYLLSTGTGLAPFLSIARDPQTYEMFDKVVITHTCREIADLSYQGLLLDELPAHDFFADLVRDRLIYYPSVTREPFHTMGRITDLIRSGKFFSDIGQPRFDSGRDRVMICGSTAMLNETKQLLLECGMAEGSGSHPGDFVVERAFAGS
ncbi:ferredoxin--NADP reductase [Sphingomonas sp.]|uniref:ferredoxin--NADP reductase n=1 Tax=Sphingomonas sp. TaxID=28214 RepID=UPI003D6C9998